MCLHYYVPMYPSIYQFLHAFTCVSMYMDSYTSMTDTQMQSCASRYRGLVASKKKGSRLPLSLLCYHHHQHNSKYKKKIRQRLTIRLPYILPTESTKTILCGRRCVSAPLHLFVSAKNKILIKRLLHRRRRLLHAKWLAECTKES